MKTFVVIPAYNEEKHIQKVIQETKKYVEDIIVIDDGSRDNTYNLAKQEGIIVLKQIINIGKGAALKLGCDYAIKKKAQKIIVLDADAQHDPNKIPYFIEKLNSADIVFGYRQLSKTMPFILRFGNKFINKTTQLLYKIDLNDTQCGYRAFTAETYKKIRWNSSDYSMESEMIAKVSKYKLNYKQIQTQTIYSDNYKGTTVLDGIKIVLKMFWWKLS